MPAKIRTTSGYRLGGFCEPLRFPCGVIVGFLTENPTAARDAR